MKQLHKTIHRSLSIFSVNVLNEVHVYVGEIEIINQYFVNNFTQDSQE